MATNKKKKSKVKVKAKAKSKAKVPIKKKAVQKAAPKKVAPPKTVRVEWSRVISPLEDRVLIAIEGASEKTAGGIIIPGNVSEKPNSGKVLAVGPGRRNKKGSVRPLDVRVGDKVIYSQMAGSTITVMNEELLILRENEILGILNN